MKRSELKLKVKTFREKLETVSQSLPDDLAQFSVAMYPHWNEEAHYETNYRVQYNDVVYKCLQSHDAQTQWTPTDAPSLWAKVLNDGIKPWERPDSTNTYMKGDKVIYNGKIYESTIDYNSYSPSEYPQGWKEVTE